MGKLDPDLEAAFVRLYDGRPGERPVVCPACGPTRKPAHRKLKTASIKRGDNGFLVACAHCQIGGFIKDQTDPAGIGGTGRPRRQASSPQKTLTPSQAPFMSAEVIQFQPEPVVPPDTPDSAATEPVQRLSQAAEALVVQRAISPSTALQCGVCSKEGTGGKDLLGFPYPTGWKIRPIDIKRYFQKGICETFWLLDRVVPGEDMIITEGEWDTLSILEVGIGSVVSVPNGAPSAVSEGKVDPLEDGKFRYVWSGKTQFDQAKRIILACDNDGPGLALAEELARRIGKARCWRLVYPDGCKDANEVLIKLGPQALKDMVQAPEPWPVAGIHEAKHYSDRVLDLYIKGTGAGESTGITSLDEYYTIAPGMLTILTGTPNAGKSALVDQVMINLARDKGWRFAIASFENPQAVHIGQLAALYTRKPFFDGPTPRMSPDELKAAIDWVNDHFFFLDAEGDMPTIEDVVDRLDAAVMRWGCRAGVIDPFSYLARDRSMPEHEWVGYALGMFKHWAVSHEAHAFCVCHPAKMQRSEDGSVRIPTGYDISGSAHFFNRADQGISIGRHPTHNMSAIVKSWKSRFRWLGKQGEVELYYDPVCSQFDDNPFGQPVPVYSGFKPWPEKPDKDPWLN